MSRKALVFGLWNYQGDDALPNARRDAHKVVETLEQRGFDCTLVEDGRGEAIMAALEAFKVRCAGAELALIYYAGHAVEHRGTGFILPTDIPSLTVGVLRTFGVAIPDLVDHMGAASTRVLVLDACRTEPLDPSLTSVINELRSTEQDWDNVLIAYSTSASDRALDGVEGEGSRFCNAFCATVMQHDLSVEDCLRDVGSTVMRQTQRRQRPWNYSSLNERISFSDLAPFGLVQTHPTGLEHLPEPFSLTHGGKGEVIAFGGPRSIWRATMAGVRAEAVTDEVVCGLAAISPTKLAVLGESGRLRLIGQTTSSPFDTGIEDAFGLRASPGGDTLAILGRGEVMLLRRRGSSVEIFFRQSLDRDVYAAVFPDRDRVWFCGVDGRILDVDWTSGSPVAHVLRAFGAHVNAMVCRSGGVYCAGHGGSIWLQPMTGPPARVNPIAQLARQVETPLARRGSLLNFAPDARIAKFLFSPRSLTAAQREWLEDRLESNRLMWVDHAPTRPLLVASNNEGLIYVIDSRDGRLVQKIDASAGRDHEIQGLCFVADDRFAALGKDGAIRFYASA